MIHHNSKHEVVISLPNKIFRLDDTQDTCAIKSRNPLAMMPFDQSTASYDRVESTNYSGINDQFNQSHRGPAYLLGMIVFNTVTAYKLINDDDIPIHLLITKFASSLARSQRVDLVLYYI